MPTLKAAAIALGLIPIVLNGQETRTARADSAARGYVGAEYSYVDFRGVIDPWRLASLSADRTTSAGSLIGRLNYARRFATTGIQAEADAYPKFNARTYGYLNVGYSAADIFPTWRFGAELFRGFAKTWEASLGVRQLRFSGTPVTLLTASAGKYSGNYWVSVRPFVTFKSTGSSASVAGTARRYFADADHYFGIRGSYGSTPSDRLTPDELARTRSYSADIHGSGGPWARAVATWALGFQREELSAGQIRRSWTGTAGVKFFF
jgi:YaiO family outer membrane protein